MYGLVDVQLAVSRFRCIVCDPEHSLPVNVHNNTTLRWVIELHFSKEQVTTLRWVIEQHLLGWYMLIMTCKKLNNQMSGPSSRQNPSRCRKVHASRRQNWRGLPVLSDSCMLISKAISGQRCKYPGTSFLIMLLCSCSLWWSWYSKR